MVATNRAPDFYTFISSDMEDASPAISLLDLAVIVAVYVRGWVPADCITSDVHRQIVICDMKSGTDQSGQETRSRCKMTLIARSTIYYANNNVPCCGSLSYVPYI